MNLVQCPLIERKKNIAKVYMHKVCDAKCDREKGRVDYVPFIPRQIARYE